MHTELRRPGVTLDRLHLEYPAHSDGYRYSAFGGHYRRWLAQQRTSMRQVYTAGEKTFVDYAGQRPSLVDPATGEVVPVELFVAVLGASNYTCGLGAALRDGDRPRPTREAPRQGEGRSRRPGR